MKKIKVSILVSVAIAVSTLCMGMAHASPLVTNWVVTDVVTFVPSSVLPGSNTYPFPVLSDANTQLHWGNSTSQSGIIIANSGVEVSAPTWVLTPTVSITHDNFPIPLGNSLTSVDILATLSLQSILPIAGPTISDDVTFGIKFIETVNDPTNGICADGTLRQSEGINANGCADIFVIEQSTLNFPLLYDSDGALNGYDPQSYFFSFFANGFGALSNSACVAAGASNGCIGIETAENQSTTVTFNILITSSPFQVPEPDSMALFAGALAALVWISRRRQRLSRLDSQHFW